MRNFGETGPDYSRLTAILVNSKLQVTNNALYQCILGLIDGVKRFQELVLGKLSNILIVQDAQGNFPAETLLGRGQGAAGPIQLITAGSGIAFVGNTISSTGTGITELTGDVTAGPGSGTQTATIPNNTVTYAKMQNVSAANKLLGRGSAAGAGDPEEITLGTNLSMSGTTLNVAGGGTGDVAGPASSIDSEIALFSGTTGKIIKRATGTGVVHATAGVFSTSNVTEAEITLANNATNNVSTTKHGFTPILPNDATKYLDGTGAYSVPAGTAGVQKKTVTLVIDGAGSVITTGVKGYIQVGVTSTILSWTILSTDLVSGAIVIDVWRDTYTNYPPDNSDSITGGNEPEIPASGTKATDATLTSWNTAITAGDILGFNVDSVTSLKKITLQLELSVP